MVMTYWKANGILMSCHVMSMLFNQALTFPLCITSYPSGLHSCDRIINVNLYLARNFWVTSGPKYVPAPRRVFGKQPSFICGSLHIMSKIYKNNNGCFYRWNNYIKDNKRIRVSYNFYFRVLFFFVLKVGLRFQDVHCSVHGVTGRGGCGL